MGSDPIHSLPDFTPEGVLPPGDHPLSLDALERSFLVRGAGVAGSTWDVAWRRELVGNLRILVGQLWAVGLDAIWIDGSFVEDKDHPNDIDGYFNCDAADFASGRIEHALNLLDPHKCWTWRHQERRRHHGFPKAQLPMWHHYRVELYPHYDGAFARVDEYGNRFEFPSMFRTRRDGSGQKGIVRIVR